MKQSLIKRARSVAIFSLKLKERRAREAEKQAYNLAEQEKVSENVFQKSSHWTIENKSDFLVKGNEPTATWRRTWYDRHRTTHTNWWYSEQQVNWPTSCYGSNSFLWQMILPNNNWSCRWVISIRKEIIHNYCINA